ncbi:helix-turn-helix domain-containing protein [Actinomadura sp. NAK00032]|uniref:helix-turn-helix domain-containing protein n=1 Tax=Actinomadura sp. NAK00032 TaxID=2742128 RepID=UPI001590B519|nr:helix-turn-helix transcriptional regulator [Actinomadura sp. NAK00032]QKW35506.1 helix-turn-helix domain-containing protein [Actinomadura sp. NAK00032]
MRSRKLGQRLKAIREERGLTRDAAARMLHRTPSSLSKLETGKRGIRRPALEYMLDRYEITDLREREDLFHLADQAADKGWWHRYQGTLLASTVDYIALENEADSIRSFQLHLVPGLLQIEGYARAIMGIGASQGKPVDVDAMTTVRLRRQRVLARPRPPQVSAVISEAVLRQEIGGAEIMDGQLRHLAEVSEMDHLTVRILPFSAGVHAGLNGSFSILDTRDLSVVLVENLTAGWYLEAEEDVRRHDWAFQQVLENSLSASDSLTLIEKLRSEI